MMIKFLDRFEEYLVAFCLGGMALLNFGNVLSRYVLKASWSFTGELLIILFVWTIMLGTAIAYKRSEHLGLPLILDMVPLKYKKILIIFAGLMSAVLMIVLTVSGYEMVMQQIEFKQTTSVLQLPEWITGISIPLGSLLILFRVFQSTVFEISKLKEVDHK